MPVNPTPPLVGGTTSRETILQGYVFQSGIHKPEHSSILSYKYPQYYMTSLLDRLGSYEGIGQDTWSWNVLDRTRKGGTVSTVAGNTTATATFEIAEFDYTAGNLGYLIVGDVIRLQSGALGRVTVSEVSATLTAKQKVTVVRLDGSAWTAALLANTFAFGHVFSAFEEASNAPTGRLHLPTEDYNNLQILRRSFEISGSEFTNRTYLEDGASWYFAVEDIEMKEFSRDREIAILFGQLGSGTVKTTRGILDWVESDGINVGYATSAGVTEADFQNMLKQMLVEGSSSEITVLCGSTFLAAANTTLKDYHVQGGVAYGSFGANTIGLDVTQYKFLGKTLNFVYYELFDDPAVLPFATASATVTNFSDFALFLDTGSDSTGQRLISLKYKELDGQSRKFVHGYVTGIMNPNGENGGAMSNAKDAFSIHYLSEIGVEVRLANRMGIMRATS